MGYPMSWRRLVNRNGLNGGYQHSELPNQNAHGSRLIAGDMRRLEEDSRDEAHLKWVAEIASITPEQAKLVLDWFFRDNWPNSDHPPEIK